MINASQRIFFLKRIVPPGPVSLVFFAAFLFFTLFFPPLLDNPDMPWHIEAGHWILSHHSLPKIDPWSYTSGGVVWYNLSWIWDVLIAFISAKAGLKCLTFFTVLLGALLITALSWILLEQRKYHADAVFLLCGIAGLSLLPYLSGRPQMFTYAAVLCFHAYLFSLKTKKANHSLQMFIFLPCLMVLWVNIHGGFLAGFIILSVFIGEAWIQKEKDLCKKLCVIAVLCGVACLCNPYGVYIIHGADRTLRSIITPYILEWQPFTYGTLFGFTLNTLLFIFISDVKDHKISFADRALAVIWLILAMDSVRHSVLFVMMAAPYLGARLHGHLVPHDWNFLEKKKKGIFIVALLAVCVSCVPMTGHFLKLKPTQLDPNIAPIEEIAYIQKHLSPDIHLYNDYGLGGYIIYLTKGTLPVFVDGRAGTAYPEKLLGDSIGLYREENEEKWLNSIKNYGVNVILTKQKILIAHLSCHKEWKLVFKGPAAQVFVRSKTELHELH